MYEKSPVKMEIGRDLEMKDLSGRSIESNYISPTLKESLDSLLIRTACIENNYVPRDEIESQIQTLLERFKDIEKRIAKFEDGVTKPDDVIQENRQSFQNEFQQFIDNNEKDETPIVEASLSVESNVPESKPEKKSVVESENWKESDDDEGIMLSMLKNKKKRKNTQEESNEDKKKKTEIVSSPGEKITELKSLVGNIVSNLVNTMMPESVEDKASSETQQAVNGNENVESNADINGENGLVNEMGKRDKSTDTELLNPEVEKRDESTVVEKELINTQKDESTVVEKELINIQKDESTNTENLSSKKLRDESTNTEPVLEILKKDVSTNTDFNTITLKTEDEIDTNITLKEEDDDEEEVEGTYDDETDRTDDDKKILSDLTELYYTMEDESSTHVCKLCSKDATNFDEVKSHIMGIHLYYIKC